MGLQLSPSDPVTGVDVCELNCRQRTFPTELYGIVVLLVHQDSLKRVRCFFIIALCPGPGGRWQVITYSGGHLWVTRVKREVSGVSRHTQRLSSQGHQGRPKVALRLASLLHCIQTVIQRDVEEAEIVRSELVNSFVLPVCVHDVTSNPITMDASSSSSGQRLNI